MLPYKPSWGPPIAVGHVRIDECKQNLELVKKNFIASSQKKKVLEFGLKYFKELFASWSILTLSSREQLERVVYFRDVIDRRDNNRLPAFVPPLNLNWRLQRNA